MMVSQQSEQFSSVGKDSKLDKAIYNLLVD